MLLGWRAYLIYLSLRNLFPALYCSGCFIYPSIFLVIPLWRGITRCSDWDGCTCSMWCFCKSLLSFCCFLVRCVVQIPGDCCVVLPHPALNRVWVAIPESGCMTMSQLLGTRHFLLKCCFPSRVVVRHIGVMHFVWRPSPAFSPLRLLLLLLSPWNLRYPMWCLNPFNFKFGHYCSVV